MRRAACSLLALYIACFGVVVHGHDPKANEATDNALQNGLGGASLGGRKPA